MEAQSRRNSAILRYIAAGFSLTFMQPLKASAETLSNLTTGDIIDGDSGVLTSKTVDLDLGDGSLIVIFGWMVFLYFFELGSVR